MAQGSYKQFCPVAMAAEVLCTRWTVLLLRELMAGSTRFNDLRRGVPRMSPALLSQRLKELETAGIVCRQPLPNRARRVRISPDCCRFTNLNPWWRPLAFGDSAGSHPNFHCSISM
ncbi:MAG: helix-turn-helix transcriptional regulator [Acetobacteraceae bacterium]|nr:helix-turn-helix transcriptional regulator [Acetobacteraceae bacterium]